MNKDANSAFRAVERFIIESPHGNSFINQDDRDRLVLIEREHLKRDLRMFVAKNHAGRLSSEIDSIRWMQEAETLLLGVGADCFYMDGNYPAYTADPNELSVYQYGLYRFIEENEERLELLNEIQNISVPVEELYFTDNNLRAFAFMEFEGKIRFTRIRFKMLHDHIRDEMTKVSDDMIYNLYPHEWVPGWRHGKVDKDGNVIENMKLKVKGKKQNLLDIQAHMKRYIDFVYQRKLDESRSIPQFCVWKHWSVENESMADLTLIISDTRLMTELFVTRFSLDLEPIVAPEEELEDQLSQLTLDMINHFEDAKKYLK